MSPSPEKPRSTAPKFILSGAIIVLTLSYLAYTGVQESKSYYVTIAELRGQGDAAYSKRLRVAGNVESGSIKRQGTMVEFVLVENEQKLNVVYKGTEAPPDTFKDDSQALVEGNFGRDGVFRANHLQAKCASKYAPKKDGTDKPSASPATTSPAAKTS
jgi:cytochrome c-type biogenesis protein CcmE